MAVLLRLSLALCLAGLLLTGPTACGSRQKPEQRFEEQMLAFHNHMRWARYDDAAEFVAEHMRWEFLGEHEAMGSDFEVTEYEIRRVDRTEDAGPVTVTVWVQQFRLPSTRVEERVYRERWEYNDARGVWELTERTLRD
ncbi:MAG: hypothetical protein EA398_14450 [Deltaproteobacteria bacterium]|nr:MAG: hypothetical protein EA398_14450 [Deltaproteobacteria bacterium]